MSIFIYIYLALVIAGLIVFVHGIKHAKEIDPKEPFIYGDYDLSKDPSKDNNIVVHECE